MFEERMMKRGSPGIRKMAVMLLGFMIFFLLAGDLAPPEDAFAAVSTGKKWGSGVTDGALNRYNGRSYYWRLPGVNMYACTGYAEWALNSVYGIKVPSYPLVAGLRSFFMIRGNKVVASGGKSGGKYYASGSVRPGDIVFFYSRGRGAWMHVAIAGGTTAGYGGMDTRLHHNGTINGIHYSGTIRGVINYYAGSSGSYYQAVRVLGGGYTGKSVGSSGKAVRAARIKAKKKAAKIRAKRRAAKLRARRKAARIRAKRKAAKIRAKRKAAKIKAKRRAAKIRAKRRAAELLEKKKAEEQKKKKTEEKKKAVKKKGSGKKKKEASKRVTAEEKEEKKKSEQDNRDESRAEEKKGEVKSEEIRTEEAVPEAAEEAPLEITKRSIQKIVIQSAEYEEQIEENIEMEEGNAEFLEEAEEEPVTEDISTATGEPDEEMHEDLPSEADEEKMIKMPVISEVPEIKKKTGIGIAEDPGEQIVVLEKEGESENEEQPGKEEKVDKKKAVKKKAEKKVQPKKKTEKKTKKKAEEITKTKITAEKKGSKEEKTKDIAAAGPVKQIKQDEKKEKEELSEGKKAGAYVNNNLNTVNDDRDGLAPEKEEKETSEEKAAGISGADPGSDPDEYPEDSETENSVVARDTELDTDTASETLDDDLAVDTASGETGGQSGDTEKSSVRMDDIALNVLGITIILASALLVISLIVEKGSKGKEEQIA